MPHIYIYSPSGVVIDKKGFRLGVKRLEQAGYEVEIDADALVRDRRFAGDDASRIAAIARAAASGADVALISRGGYGISRLLPKLPYKAITKSIQNGMRWVGYSDFTALQLALLSKSTKANTWAGPALVGHFGQAKTEEITLACLDDVVAGRSEGTGWRLPKKDQLLYTAKSRSKTHHIQDAVLWGGNLCVLTSLIGTPYLPQIESGILFVEDVAEHPYRVERMFLQLHQAGVLAKQKAIVLGSFTGYKLGAMDKGYDMPSVVDYLRQLLKIPVITGLPFGHIDATVSLPVGRKVDLLLDDKDAYLIWGHVH